MDFAVSILDSVMDVFDGLFYAIQGDGLSLMLLGVFALVAFLMRKTIFKLLLIGLTLVAFYVLFFVL